jgi:hypothetical protein
MVDIATEVEPDFTDVLLRVFEAARSQEFGPILASVETYDATRGVCDATPIVAVSIDGELVQLPTLRCIPVQWPGGGGIGAGSGAFTAPLAKGDVVELSPQMADFSGWQTHGALGQEPPDPRRSQLSDVVAKPRFRPMNSPLPAEALANDGPVVYGPTAVYLARSVAADFVALASKVNAHLTALQTYLDSHIHPTPSGPSSPPTVPSPVPPTTVGSTIIHAE